MKRKIIQIDEEKCNGCGKCIPNCAEGALRIIDGKARLISDLFCDGLGACLGECPLGAISVIEREAEPYDERKVMEGIIAKGPNMIRAHLEHLKSHGEEKLLRIAHEVLQKQNIPIPAGEAPKLACGCPGHMAKVLSRPNPETTGNDVREQASALRQWPVQLHLLNPDAAYFDHADLLISADCVAHACGNFHTQLLPGKILVIFCPKLDGSREEYEEKLAEIFRKHSIRSITVARMSVPCCGGTVEIARNALTRSGREIPFSVRIFDLDGTPVPDGF